MDNPERQNDKQHKTRQRMGNEEWTIQRDRTTNNTKPVREWVIKNGQSRETERQTTQNQLENG